LEKAFASQGHLRFERKTAAAGCQQHHEADHVLQHGFVKRQVRHDLLQFVSKRFISDGIKPAVFLRQL
jgi:hypothetical protein